MKNLFTLLSHLWSSMGNLLSNDAICDCRLTVGSPSGLDAKWKQKSKMLRYAAMVLLLTIGVGNAWGDVTLEFTTGSSDGGQALTDATRAQWMTSASKDLCTLGSISNAMYYYSKAEQYGGPRGIRIGKSSAAGYATFNIASGSQITSTSIVVEASRYNTSTSVNLSIQVNGGSELTAQTLSDADVTIREYTFTFSSATVTSVRVNTTKYAYIKSITIKSAASCSVNPSATGDASINGSFTLTSLTDAVSVSSGTWGAGSNCSWTDYGFVWGTSSSLSTSNNKVEVGTSGQATSWATDASHKVQPSGSTDPTSWSVGTTYYVKAYGKNGKAGATYYYSTNAASFTLRSITYNSNGGSTVNTQYVNSGGTYSAPTAPTKTGYNFEGWYTDNGTFENAMNWGNTISENKVLYAKWTAKTTTVTLDNQSATTAGAASVTATYDAAVPSIATNLPAKTGYTFGGYYTSTGGGGTQYIKADGTSAQNLDITDATKTLYAKWTVQSYKVTWMVNGEEYTAGGSTSVNYGSHVATLPTAPTPSCGDKFMGWTTTNIGSVGQATDEGLNLFTTAGGAPTISAEGDVTYYAVFADYAE